MRLRYGMKVEPKRGGSSSRNPAASRDSDSRDIGSYLGPARPLPPHLREMAEWADNPASWKK